MSDLMVVAKVVPELPLTDLGISVAARKLFSVYTCTLSCRLYCLWIYYMFFLR